MTCVKQAGKITVASGAIGGQQGLGIVMTDEATPVVESLGMVVDGNALAVANAMGAKSGSAEVTVDGNRNFALIGQEHDAGAANGVTLSISGNDNNNPFYSGIHDFTGAAADDEVVRQTAVLVDGGIRLGDVVLRLFHR